MSRPNARRAGALCAIALWVVGFELLPVAHVSGHHALGEHTHDGAGGVSFVDREENSFQSSLNRALGSFGGSADLAAFHQRHAEHRAAHGDHSHSDHSHSDAGEGPEFEHLESASAPHGAHSVAHRDLAAATPPLPPIPLGAAYLVPAIVEMGVMTLELPRVASAFRARGPPA